jgi:hypothetical protein
LEAEHLKQRIREYDKLTWVNRRSSIFLKVEDVEKWATKVDEELDARSSSINKFYESFATNMEWKAESG